MRPYFASRISPTGPTSVTSRSPGRSRVVVPAAGPSVGLTGRRRGSGAAAASRSSRPAPRGRRRRAPRAPAAPSPAGAAHVLGCTKNSTVFVSTSTASIRVGDQSRGPDRTVGDEGFERLARGLRLHAVEPPAQRRGPEPCGRVGAGSRARRGARRDRGRSTRPDRVGASGPTSSMRSQRAARSVRHSGGSPRHPREPARSPARRSRTSVRCR